MIRFPKTAAAVAFLAASTLGACSNATSRATAPIASPSGTSASSAVVTATPSASTASASPSGSASSTPAPSTSASASASSVPAVAGTQISITNFAYSPVALSVAAGATVTVTNHDTVAHTVTGTTGIPFDTGSINPGQTGTFKAPTTPGTYPYFCTFHTYMHGTLVVHA